MISKGAESPSGRRRPYAPRLPPELRREQALDVALDLITDGGLATVSIEAVAARMGVTKTVLYKFVANTDELLVALVEREERRAVQQVREFLPFDVAAASGDPVDATIDGVLRFFDAVRHQPGTWHLLVTADGLPAIARERRQKAVDAVAHNIASLAAWATSRRRSEPLDPDLAARTLVAFLETLVRLTLEQPEAYPPQRVNDFIKAALRSIVAG